MEEKAWQDFYIQAPGLLVEFSTSRIYLFLSKVSHRQLADKEEAFV